MKDLRKLLLYLAASIVIGALVAPLVFKCGGWLAGRGIFTGITGQGFNRYFNRSVEVTAILLLWPLARSLKVQTLAELGLQWDARWLSRLAFGFAAAVAMMAVMSLLVFAFGGIVFRPAEQRLYGELPKVIFTAACVGFIEECIFRGAFLGLLQRTMPRTGALLASAVFFSVVHFIQPPSSAVAPADVTWSSGFALIPAVFGQWRDPMMIGASFTTLLAVGWVLGWAMQRTRSLWLGIGLHAGWVFCVQGFGKFAYFAPGKLPWIGADIRIGLAPLITVILTGVLCLAWLSHGRRGDRA
ncbi:MAG: CPBP family intramembrane glutamic endopeptidase [Chthoniobacteraceae bacterium]